MDSEERPQDRTLRISRLEAFSDGVFAIAITLLVLEISVPPGSEDNLWQAFLDQWPSYLGYVVSFATVGAVWLAHNGVTDYLERSDLWLLRLNLLLLMVVSFLPFPTKLLAESLGGDDAGVATTIYGINLLAISALMAVLWRHAVRRSLVRPDTSDEEIRVLTDKLTPGIGGYAAMIALGIFLPIAAVVPADRALLPSSLRGDAPGRCDPDLISFGLAYRGLVSVGDGL